MKGGVFKMLPVFKHCEDIPRGIVKCGKVLYTFDEFIRLNEKLYGNSSNEVMYVRHVLLHHKYPELHKPFKWL